MKGLKYLFTVPEGEKITEKHLTRVLVSSICSILLCMSCLVSTSWAWFAVSIENTGNVIEVGEFAIGTKVTDLADGSEVQPTSLYKHGYYLPEGEYSVQIEMQEGSVAGYCEVYVDNERLGTLVLDQATFSLSAQGTELLIKVNEAVPVLTMTATGEGEPMPNLVIVPTWGSTTSEDMLLSNVIEVGEERVDTFDRYYAVIMNNAKEAMPFNSITQADLFFEMLIDRNAAVTRGLALFTGVDALGTIGSVRSLRYNFTDLAQAYDAILVHASGNEPVLQDLKAAGIDHLNVDGDIGYRDYERYESYAWEHCLFVAGVRLKDAAANKDYEQTTQKDNGLNYAAAGNTSAGVDAAQIEIAFAYDGTRKTTTMVYNNGTYEFHQYGQLMTDEYTVSTVTFDNVMVLYADTTVDSDGYYVAELTGTGTGWFAWGGKIVEINWSRANDTDPFTFILTDGTPVTLGTGNTYIAIAPTGSPVTFQ